MKVEHNGVVLDFARKELTWQGRTYLPSRAGMQLLEVLMFQPGWVRSADHIANCVRMPLDVGSNVKRLRNALAEAFGDEAREWIRSRHGLGYQWVGPD